MNAVIVHVAAAVTPQVTPLTAESFVVSVFRGGAVEHVPVETNGRFTVRSHREIALALLIEDAHEVNVSELAVGDVLLRGVKVRSRAILQPDLNDTIVFPCSLDSLSSFPAVVALRLLAVDVFAGLTTPDRCQCVPVWRSGDDYPVDRLIFEHPAKVFGVLWHSPPLKCGDPFRSSGVHLGIDVTKPSEFAIVATGERLRKRISAPAASDDR